MLLEIAGATAALALLLWLVLTPASEPLYGVYAQPGKWNFFKKCIAYFMLKRGYLKIRDAIRDCVSGYEVQAVADSFKADGPQDLFAEEEHALDAVYFNGVNKDGVCLVMRIGRRPNREAELWLSIKVPGMGFYQSPVHPDTKVYNTDGKGFNVGGLRFECLEPHKKWKINFNGVLREGLCNASSEKDKGNLVHVKFSFFWDTFSDVFDLETDNDTWWTADAISRETWTSAFWSDLGRGRETHYEQCGELRGVLNIEGKEEMKLYLRGCRNRLYGVRDWSSFHRYVVHRGWVEDGSTFHVGAVSSYPLSYLQCGYLNRPNSFQHAINSVSLDMPNLGENGTPPRDYGFSFRAGGRNHHVQVKGHTTPVYYHGCDWGSIIHEMMCEFIVNGKKGWGVAEFCYRAEGVCPVPHQKSVPLLREPENVSPQDESALVLTLDQPSCCSSRLVGGKGGNLAMIRQMSQSEDTHFTVPPGFCLTLEAFAKHLRMSNVLEEHVDNLTNIACGKKAGSLRDACDQTVAVFLDTSLCPEVQECIEKHLSLVFSEDWHQQRFAVRSSAAGEDSAELSSAGQMETVLGVKGFEQIVDAVRRCWSSQFTFTAVEYRRQYGQSINSLTGVVIQRMVPAETAGVLFTRHPLTGNPHYTTINASYGLGESVVSGSSEPDFITVRKDLNENVEITKTEIGSKKTQITMTDVGGTSESEVSAEKSKTCCISDEVILKLTGIGIQLEKHFSDPRDIEWAVAGGRIYLLQARPITALDPETEWELMHEFDTPLTTDKEVMTRHNAGEILPGCASPLSMSVIVKEIETSSHMGLTKTGIQDKVFSYRKLFGFYCNQSFLNVSFLESFYQGNVFGVEKEGVETSLCGEPVHDYPLDDVIEYNGWRPLYRRLWNAYLYWKCVQDAGKGIKHWAKRLETYKLHLESLTTQEVYETLMARAEDFSKCHENHGLSSAASIFWTTIVMQTVTRGAKKMETEHCADVAMLLSKCDGVYSADVPVAIQKLANTIRTGPQAKAFPDMEPEDALLWLKSDESGEASRQFEEFMTRHGYRCIRELEIHDKSWRSEPSKIIKTLQAMLRAPSGHDSSSVGIQDVDEAIAKLKTPVSALGRQMLKFILPRARRAVGCRENGKAATIHMVEHLRQGYWKLAHMMVEEGRIPDADLLFYFTQTEIGQLLKCRSGRLIAKAQRRRRIQPKLEKFEFHLMYRSHPQPIVDEEEEFSTTTLKFTGTPVSHGATKGTARVVVSLDKADAIQTGDILVVKSTNVGWSPYFPLLSGLVTEMGGLVSHGAVVAREYGIPCVVNIRKATSIFKSGDIVLLNGTTGTFEKVVK